MLRLRAGACLIGFVVLARLPAPERARDGTRVDCDTLVRARAGDPLGYRLRGDRCEGLYGVNVSGSSELRIVALVDSVDAFDDSSSLPLRVEWTPPPGAAVTLRATATRAGLYYRMETARPTADSMYLWPSDVRRMLRLGRGDVAVLGIANTPTIGTHEVLVPLRIGQRRRPARAASYHLVLLPTTGLSEVYVSISRTVTEGMGITEIQRDQPLGYGFYPAGRPIDVRLPPLGARGFFEVSIGATRESGGSVTATALLYHPGAPRRSGR